MLLRTRNTLPTTVALRFLLSADHSTLRLLLLAAYHSSSFLACRRSLLIFIIIRLLHTVGSRLLAFCRGHFVTRWSFFSVHCHLLTARFSLFASSFSLLGYFFRTPLAVCCSLHITICMLLFIPQLTNHRVLLGLHLSLPNWSLYAALDFLLDNRLVLLVSRHSLSLFGCCRQPDFFSKLLSSC